MAKRIVMAVGAMLLTGSAAFGQTASAPAAATEGRVFLAASGGAQLGSAREESTAFSFTLYAEPASVGVKRSVKSGILGDFTAGGRVLGNLGVAGTLFFRQAPGDGVVTASIPDPIFYDKPRAVSSTIVDMTHREVWSAVQAVYIYQATDKVDVMFMGGPTVVSLAHQVATAATVTEGANSATVTVSTTELKKMVWGYTLGADVRYMITRNLGFGAFARYSGATANLSDTVSLKLGGLQVGGGIRIAIW